MILEGKSYLASNCCLSDVFAPLGDLHICVVWSLRGTDNLKELHNWHGVKKMQTSESFLTFGCRCNFSNRKRWSVRGENYIWRCSFIQRSEKFSLDFKILYNSFNYKICIHHSIFGHRWGLNWANSFFKKSFSSLQMTNWSSPTVYNFITSKAFLRFYDLHRYRAECVKVTVRLFKSIRIRKV